MNFNNFTIKSQEVVQKAVQICQSSGHQAIEPVHLLKAMTDDSESVTKFIFQKRTHINNIQKKKVFN